jgi:hypothetical protein
VPLVATDNWFDEPELASKPAPPPARFLSQDEEDEENTAQPDEMDEPAFFSASSPVADPAAIAAPLSDAATSFDADQMDDSATPARPRFDELSEEPAYTPLPRDYAPDFGTGRSPAILDEHRADPSATLFSEPAEDAQRDLDTPAFMRRIQF